MTEETGRSRAGNAMARTRGAVLSGARQCIVAAGSRKTTMVDIAATAGVAKATLYNHFRTKSEVFAALAESEVAQAAADTAELVATTGLATALVRLAQRLGEHPVVRRLAADEPQVLALLVLPEQAGAGAATWNLAHRSLADLLPAGVAVDPVLRYLVSQLLWPAAAADLETAVALLLAPAPAAAPAPAPAAPPADGGVPVTNVQVAPGLGFPTSQSVGTEPVTAGV